MSTFAETPCIVAIFNLFFRFITTALQQSTVRLTWDETDPRRVQTTMRNFSKDDILDMDFKAYLASSGNDESDREIEESENKQSQESKIAKYKVIKSVLSFRIFFSPQTPQM